MTRPDTDLETVLTETLRAKAAQVPDVTETFDPPVVALGDGDRRRARPALLAAAAVALVVAVAVGVIVALGDQGIDRTRQPAGPPTGPPVARIEIEALPELSFQAKEFTTVPGINEIDFVSRGGTHSLVFADPSLAYFYLNAPVGPHIGKVDLEAGRDYTIFCSVPGHRAAGMEAVIHVAPGPDVVPPSVTGTEQTLTAASIPDYADNLFTRPFGRQWALTPGTLRAFSANGSDPFVLFDATPVDGSLLSTLPDGNRETVVGMYLQDNRTELGGYGIPSSSVPLADVQLGSRPAVFVAPQWPEPALQVYVWTRLPAGAAYVSYTWESTQFWERPLDGTAVFVMERPAVFNGPMYSDWHNAPLPLLRAFDADGNQLSEVKAPRIGGDDYVVSPSAPGE